LAGKSYYQVSEQQRHIYQRDGVVLLPAVIDSEWQQRLCTAIAKAVQKSDKYFHRYLLWPEDNDFADFCRHSLVSRIAADLTDSNKINLLYDQAFVKPAASATATGWHNDQPYWPVKGEHVITLWIALDEVTEASGAMEFIRGSHRWQRRFAPFIADENGEFSHYVEGLQEYHEPLPDFEAERDQYDILSWSMQPGDVLAFNGWIVHGARGNTSDHSRRAYAVRYTGQDVCYWVDAATNDFLINPLLKQGDPLDSEQFPVVYSCV